MRKKSSAPPKKSNAPQKTAIGIFGGSFNPPHRGHLESARNVGRRLGLETVYLVPAAESPGKNPRMLVDPRARLEMLNLAVGRSRGLEVSDWELLRPGPSFTINTLKHFAKAHPKKRLFLIVGADQFLNLDAWRSPSEILASADLVVTSKPGAAWPISESDFPRCVKNNVLRRSSRRIELKTGREILFLKLKDVKVSSSEIRKRLIVGKSIENMVNDSLRAWLEERRPYRKSGTTTELDFESITKAAADVLSAKKGFGIKAYDMRKLQAPSEFVVVASGTSTRHAESLCEAVQERLREKYALKPIGVEGREACQWLLLDYGALIVHVFYDYTRHEYKIDELFAGGVEMPLEQSNIRGA